MSHEKVLNNKSSLVVADLELDSNIQVPTYDQYRKWWEPGSRSTSGAGKLLPVETKMFNSISWKRLQGIVHPKAYKVDLKPWLDPADQGGKCLTNPDACKDDPQLGFEMSKV